jgi:hypothetical protein
MPGVRNADRVILFAMLLCLPTIMQTFNGGLAMESALERFALALMLSWAGGAIVERLFDNYSRQARQNELARRIQQVAAAHLAAAERERDLFKSPPPGDQLPG